MQDGQRRLGATLQQLPQGLLRSHLERFKVPSNTYMTYDRFKEDIYIYVCVYVC